MTIKDFGGDRFEEQQFVVTANLDRRHLTEAQKSAIGLKLLEIEQEEAKDRQKQAGEQHKGNLRYQENASELKEDRNNHWPRTNSSQADNKGKALELAALQVGVGYDTLRRANKIEQAAKTDQEIAASWDQAKQGQGSVNKVYRQLQEKEREQKAEKADSELGRTLIEKEESNKKLLERPDEVLVPDSTKQLGPWALDFVHEADLWNLVREFPDESVDLIYTESVVGLELLGFLGEFASKILRQGKFLCVYVDKRHLYEDMVRLTAVGLTYYWTCVAVRPADKVEVPDYLIRDNSRLLLVFRKGATSECAWKWFEDTVESRQPSNRDLARQVMAGLTTQGQLVVDPFVGSSGITGKVALSLGRRFLGFGVNKSDVQAANQHISKLRQE